MKNQKQGKLYFQKSDVFQTYFDKLASLSYANVKSLTVVLDKALLERHTYVQLLSIVEKYRSQCLVTDRQTGIERQSNDFRTIARVRSHVNFRKVHDNIIFDVSEQGIMAVDKA